MRVFFHSCKSRYSEIKEKFCSRMEASKHCFLCVHVLVTGGGGAGAGGDCADALKKAYFFFQRLYFCVIIKLDLLLKNIFKS